MVPSTIYISMMVPVADLEKQLRHYNYGEVYRLQTMAEEVSEA